MYTKKVFGSLEPRTLIKAEKDFLPSPYTRIRYYSTVAGYYLSVFDQD